MQPEDKEADRIRGHGFTYIVRPQTRERCQRKFKEHEDGRHKLKRYNKNGLVLFGVLQLCIFSVVVLGIS